MKEACFLPRDNNFIWTHTHTYSLYKHTQTRRPRHTYIQEVPAFQQQSHPTGTSLLKAVKNTVPWFEIWHKTYVF